jgi:site-specific DNA-methyltransferase (adenine-specific)
MRVWNGCQPWEPVYKWTQYLFQSGDALPELPQKNKLQERSMEEKIKIPDGIKPYYSTDLGFLVHGDCLEVLEQFSDNHADTVLTDPPYGIKFMGKKWDYEVPSVGIWQEVLRVSKPGAMLMCFGGTRTFHRMAVNIEDAGLEIRDTVMWVYGSGFPKSHDISKAIDREAGKKRKVIANKPMKGKMAELSKFQPNKQGYPKVPRPKDNYWSGNILGNPITKEAQQWKGYGTALKPAWEPVIVAMKPIDGTFANNALKWGVAGLNIDECRIGTEQRTNKGMSKKMPDCAGTFRDDNWKPKDVENTVTGRFPANLIHDGSDEVLACFPDSKSCNSPSNARSGSKFRPGQGAYQKQGPIYPGDSGLAARFFYCAKVSRKERNAGLDCEEKPMLWSSGTKNPGSFQSDGTNKSAKNNHPTVKPIDLLIYLLNLTKMTTGGIVLDPFIGSGTTAIDRNRDRGKILRDCSQTN